MDGKQQILDYLFSGDERNILLDGAYVDEDGILYVNYVPEGPVWDENGQLITVPMRYVLTKAVSL